MNTKLFTAIALFSVFVSCRFIVYNPNLATELGDDYAQGEVFLPKDNYYDFKTFTINSKAKNFTARIITQSHVMMIDDTGDTTINVVDTDNMINSQNNQVNHILGEEIKKSAWTADGVSIHQINFIFHSPLYAAYYKNSISNTIIYLSTPNEQETADMMNSLTFSR